MSGIDGVAAVRPAADEELAGLAEVEKASEAPFAEAGMVLPAEYMSADALRKCAIVLVAPGPTGTPVGFAAVDVVDGAAHLSQLSVDAAYARQGIGRGLLAAVIGWARRGGLPAVTLTTFRDVPWNAPFYRRYGFVDLDEADLTPGLREARAHEIADGLDEIAPRLAMRRPLRAS
ncbi:GNAT family N-acetyltransferase [Cryptosporangium aurantiacum]|uniref:Ribosomal protein S18 acetylase RimI n=1 Tax=Cryptosporangium aurantiacum TaxID=134849 RepID=A0A1M7NCW5_9ACTN|nr:GNAT family N-acetyltransferase [Cryptosporangium aurantiacum]SHN01506.1 Ribosomal protein S18 acetylase RimI [Cryptosporangium aurantiacum]